MTVIDFKSPFQGMLCQLRQTNHFFDSDIPGINAKTPILHSKLPIKQHERIDPVQANQYSLRDNSIQGD
jgi:hypothetical protein